MTAPTTEVVILTPPGDLAWEQERSARLGTQVPPGIELWSGAHIWADGHEEQEFDTRAQAQAWADSKKCRVRVLGEDGPE